MTKPAHQSEFELIDRLCLRWAQVPSVIRRESAYDVLQMAALGLFAQPEAEPY